MKKKGLRFILVIAIAAAACISLNGCLLLDLPFRIIGATLDIAGKVVDLINKLPTPPPGVF